MTAYWLLISDFDSFILCIALTQCEGFRVRLTYMLMCISFCLLCRFCARCVVFVLVASSFLCSSCRFCARCVVLCSSFRCSLILCSFLFCLVFVYFSFIIFHDICVIFDILFGLAGVTAGARSPLHGAAQLFSLFIIIFI